MALKFLSTHRIALTPLSPIHIGCGETFEPTNYVIDREPLDVILTFAQTSDGIKKAGWQIKPERLKG